MEKAIKIGSKKYRVTLLADIMYDTVEEILIENSNIKNEFTVLKWLVRFSKIEAVINRTCVYILTI